MSIKRPVVVTKFPTDVQGKIAGCDKIKNSMTGNEFFKNPVLSMADFGTRIAALIESQAEVDAGTAGGTAKRNEALAAMMLDVARLTRYVQDIADASPDIAERIIESAGMYVKGSRGKKTQIYEVISEDVGNVYLTIPVNPKPYVVVWEISMDNEVWQQLRISRLTACSMDGLVSGKVYYFRYFIIGEDNERTAYSEVTSCRVK